jgi:hypothetical protein
MEGSARLEVVGGDGTVMPKLGRLRGRRPRFRRTAASRQARVIKEAQDVKVELQGFTGELWVARNGELMRRPELGFAGAAGKRAEKGERAMGRERKGRVVSWRR